MFRIRASMKSDGGRPTRDVELRPPASVLSGVFRRGKATRDLFLVKFAFWAVVVGLVLLVVLVLWGLATHGPSQSPFDSGD